jgi:hypothetical protein
MRAAYQLKISMDLIKRERYRVFCSEAEQLCGAIKIFNQTHRNV